MLLAFRLAEALETDEGAEYYPEDGSDSQLLKKDVRSWLAPLGFPCALQSAGLREWALQVDYNPEVLDSYVSNPKKGFKRRHAKIIEEEDEEEEEEEDKLAVYEAEPFNSDIEAMDPDYNPKHKFPLPKEVWADRRLYDDASHCCIGGLQDLMGRSALCRQQITQRSSTVTRRSGG